MRLLKRVVPFLLILAMILGLYALSTVHFLLFHVLAELFSVIIGFSVFVFVWHSRSYLNNNGFLIILGFGSVFAAAMDLIHTLAYQGMNLFPGDGANLPTQLWIAARYLQGITFFLAVYCTRKKVKIYPMLAAYAFVFSVLLISIFAGWFPACYVDGTGLTPFKIGSEYLISAILLGAIVTLMARRRVVDPRVMHLMLAALVLSIISELAFTFYISVYGLSNVVGHLFKVGAFFFIYRAILFLGFENPMNIIFEDLRRNQQSMRLFGQVFEEAIEGMLIMNQSREIIAVNRAFTTLTGYTQTEIIGRQLTDLDAGLHTREEYRAMWQSLEQEQQWHGEFWVLKQDSTRFPSWASLRAVLDDNGAIQNYFMIFINISERKQYETQLQHIALHDPLTDLPNRRYFYQRLQEEILRASEHGEKFALLFLDLDSFKEVNDRFGHEMGDRVLIAYARRLKHNLRKNDFVSRIAGDEFLVLLGNVGSRENAEMIAAHLMERLEAPIVIDQCAANGLTSVGVSLYPDDAETIDALIQYADTRMYAQKTVRYQERKTSAGSAEVSDLKGRN
ncbi:MAG: diguanylate cyclase [Anaerolineaceae bacterium]|nr:diguanylate cyclase [Anaerolineaceae bacterium]